MLSMEKMKEIAKEIEKYKVDLIALQERTWKENACIQKKINKVEMV